MSYVLYAEDLGPGGRARLDAHLEEARYDWGESPAAQAGAAALMAMAPEG